MDKRDTGRGLESVGMEWAAIKMIVKEESRGGKEIQRKLARERMCVCVCVCIHMCVCAHI